jgi:2-keto-4-pentenoate hydratase/2-oxohepta-3-ene-1,7-dioic acid hydratase in catechol pathway
VLGYSIFNDASIRDYQRMTTQWTVGKNFDATGSFGPHLMLAKALPPGAAGLELKTILNGEVVQQANTEDMIFNVAESIALLSKCMTLEAGDVLVMGTPGGVGAMRSPKLFMKPGDICQVYIEGIGMLTNHIAHESN